MSYERYKDYRLAPDDNGCWSVLNNYYDPKGTYPSKAAAKRAIDGFSNDQLQPHQQPKTVQITFEGEWKWIGALPHDYMVKLCAFADRLQDEANDNGDLDV
jgi:hypothetical protein